MIVSATVRRRSTDADVLTELNPGLVEALATISGFWGLDVTALDAQFLTDPAPEDFPVLSLRTCLAPGLSGVLIYGAASGGNRNLTRDKYGDDILELDIDTDLVNLHEFSHSVVPRLIEVLGAYRASVETDIDVLKADAAEIADQRRTTHADMAGRDGIFRIWPVSYFDDEFCQDSFQIGAAEVVERAAPACERAELLNGGAYLILTSELVTGRKALDRLSVRVASRITPWRGFLYRLLRLGFR